MKKQTLALLSIVTVCAVHSAIAADDVNPLLTESTLPYQLPPFDKIKNEDFQPALEQGMAEQLQEIDKIATNKEQPTFENTIVAMERSGRLLQRANRTFSNLNGCNTNPELQRIDKEMSPKFAAHQDAIRLNGPLFARVQAIYDERDKLKLDPESKFLVERYYKDFVRAGAKLSDPDKTKLKAMNAELATLQTQFEQNVLKEKNASSVIVDKREDLDGLPETAIAAAAAAAKDEKQEGKFAIRLQNTTNQPPLDSLKNRELRQRIMEASLSRNSKGGEFDNREIVTRIA
ncbi:MAG: dipeptidyl carboxypeptidase II, partial [Verrucomicrobiota bacterium]|nr:dipeptidyl carboxypeptidase II [Verrucomicrobiota bacterium]